MNLNKGCIEMFKLASRDPLGDWMNLNKGCIEMARRFYRSASPALDEP